MNTGRLTHAAVFTVAVSIAVWTGLAFVRAPTAVAQGDRARLQLTPIPGAVRRNVVLVLVDDHRYDAMGFIGHPFLETPNIDAPGDERRPPAERVRDDRALLAEPGVDPHRPLRAPPPRRRQQQPDSRRARCSSRSTCRRPGTRRRSSASGTWAATATTPQPGFDRWVSFRGQGTYLPIGDGLNVDGRRVPQKGYITDELTDYAIDWLKGRSRRAAVLPLPVAQGGPLGVRAGRAAQGPLRGQAVHAAGDDGGCRE